MKFTDKLALALINDAKKPRLKPKLKSGYSTPGGRDGGMIRKLQSGEEGNREIYQIGNSGRTSGAVGGRDDLLDRLKAYKANKANKAKDRTNIMKESKIELYTTMAYLVAENLGLGRDVGTPTQRAFKVGTEMANREKKKPETAQVNKKRREKLKKAGHGSVSAGMKHQSKINRGES